VTRRDLAIIRRAILATGQRAGFIRCPICDKGRIGYTVVGPRGLVHAKCTTPNCVNLKE
jgi:hypothetical protein